MMSFKTFGDWNKFNNLTKTLAPDLRRSALKGQEKSVNKIAQIVKGHLRNQDLPWRPLSDYYLAHKKENRDKILIETWKYYESIKVYREKNVFSVGVRKDRFHPSINGRISMASLAMIHENGTNNLFGKGIRLPKRPLWKPSLREFNQMGGIQAIVVKQLRQDLYNRGWTKTIVRKLRDFKAPVK
jgi:hypothetical protein